MKWFNVELEIPIWGKEFELVNATTIDEANLIAKTNASRKYNCSKDSIMVIRCKITSK